METNKEFLEYEECKNLKELDFKELCFFSFDNCSTPMRCTDLRTNEQKFYGVNYNSSSYTSQPTFSQAFRWFRDKYKLNSYIEDIFVHGTLCFVYVINGKEFIDIPTDTHEEAELACLRELIKIVKDKIEASKKLAPGIVLAPYINKEHTEESLKDYNMFMEAYRKEHKVCPKCKGQNHSSTLVGYILNSARGDEYKDLNECVCSDCGHRHTVHERISEIKNI